MLTEMYSILKRSALAILMIIGILVAIQQTSAARQAYQLKKFGQVSHPLSDNSNPFIQDLSNVAPSQAAEYWNDWGNTYSHTGPITNTIVCYLNAIRLMPQEPMYRHNLAVCIFMYRKDAKMFFDVSEEHVFAMAMKEFRKARLLDPTNYDLAKETAQAQFGVKPFNAEDAYKDWAFVVRLVEGKDANERDDVYLSMARACSMGGRYEEAQKWLAKVTTESHIEIKNALRRKVMELTSNPSPHAYN